MAPRKVRVVANLIKGMDADEAKAQLRFLPKKAGSFLLKLLNSAVANAKHNFSLEENNLYISKILVDVGPSLKRWMPRAMGRVTPILKRTCHITLVLSEREKKFNKEKRGVSKEKNVSGQKEEKRIGGMEQISGSKIMEKEEAREAKQIFPKPFGTSGVAKKRFFSRQTFGNFKKDIKRLFIRRKSV